jgi:hypothetical protein
MADDRHFIKGRDNCLVHLEVSQALPSRQSESKDVTMIGWLTDSLSQDYY